MLFANQLLIKPFHPFGQDAGIVFRHITIEKNVFNGNANATGGQGFYGIFFQKMDNLQADDIRMEDNQFTNCTIGVKSDNDDAHARGLSIRRNVYNNVQQREDIKGGKAQ